MLALALAATSVTGCSFAPHYERPSTPPAAQQYQELPASDDHRDDWKQAEPLDQAPRGAWWAIFHDPKLDRLERQLIDANQNLKAAYARLRQARDDTRVARADYWPTLLGKATGTRSRVSPNSPEYTPGHPTEGNDFDLEADLSYEVDLWGRVRNEVANARATQQASAADLAFVRLSLSAELATDYFQLRSQDAQVALLDQATGDYEQSLQLEQRLYDGGAAALTDVAQAQAQLANARTQAADTRLQRAQSQHAIAVLLGENATTYRFEVDPLTDEVVPPAIDVGLPSALLERRPDVGEAERRVAAANAQIGVARAAFFPQLTLDASAGFNSFRTGNWITAPSQFWSFGPQINVPLFEGGRLRAQSDKAREQYNETVANYRNTALSAFQDVEDSLASLRQLAQEGQTQADAIEATRVVLEQANDRYKGGLVTFLEVSTAETNALQARLSGVAIQTRRMTASVLLVKALGGGWEPHDARRRTPPAAAPAGTTPGSAQGGL
ncbi:MAG TPA: efflux transporter outer membrane subunit [Steroidobacteraceae bacterium]|nr:efflux transporter outer membrane subunit [Steroidobacteraceae bacterium]